MSFLTLRDDSGDRCDRRRSLLLPIPVTMQRVGFRCVWDAALLLVFCGDGSKMFDGILEERRRASRADELIDEILFRAVEIDNAGTGSGLSLREPPDAVPFRLEKSVLDAGTTATVGTAVAVATATAPVTKLSGIATENGLGGLLGECWEEDKFAPFGCAWVVHDADIPSFASAAVVVSRFSWLLNRAWANSDSRSESVGAIVDRKKLPSMNFLKGIGPRESERG